jgi:hypothetical protein
MCVCTTSCSTIRTGCSPFQVAISIRACPVRRKDIGCEEGEAATWQGRRSPIACDPDDFDEGEIVARRIDGDRDSVVRCRCGSRGKGIVTVGIVCTCTCDRTGKDVESIATRRIDGVRVGVLDRVV